MTVALRSEHETLQDRLAAAESALAAARRELQQREEAWAAERAEILSRCAHVCLLAIHP